MEIEDQCDLRESRKTHTNNQTKFAIGASPPASIVIS